MLNVRFASLLDFKNNKMSLRDDPNWLPRTWLVDSVEVIPDEQAVLDRMREAEFNPATTVIIESPPRLKITPQNGPVGLCRIIKVGPGHLEVETQSDRDTYLVLSEIFYPGWKATVDGRDVPLEPADYVISALPVSAGTHRIACRYQPASVTLGAACTTLTVLAAVFIALYGRRSKRSRGQPETGLRPS